MSSTNNARQSENAVSLKCTRCQSTDVVTDFHAGEVVCRGCGVVLKDRLIDSSSEVRTFAEDEPSKNPEHRAAFSDNSIGSSRTFFGGQISDEVRAALNRSVMFTSDKVEDSVIAVVNRVKEVSNALNISRCVTVNTFTSFCLCLQLCVCVCVCVCVFFFFF